MGIPVFNLTALQVASLSDKGVSSSSPGNYAVVFITDPMSLTTSQELEPAISDVLGKWDFSPDAFDSIPVTLVNFDNYFISQNFQPVGFIEEDIENPNPEPFDFTEIDQIDLADPRELEAIAKDFDNIFFQHYTLPPHASHHEETDSNKFESDLFEDAGTASTIDATETFSDDLDLGPQIVWVISIENEQDDDSPDSGQSNLIIDMDGIVFSGDFDMYWKDAYGVNSDEEADWKESKYSTDSLAIEQLYLDHPEISGNLFPSDEEIIDIIRHPPVVLADKAESLQDGLYLVQGEILATGDSPVSEVGFILSNSIRFETPIRSIGERLG